MDTESATPADASASVGLFENTHWTIVMQAKAECLASLNKLCLTYRSPLIVWLRCRGEKADDAEDQVQGFFEHLLKRDFLKEVARERGRFRSFLLATFQHYLCDQHRRAVAAKRGGGQAILSLDATNEEGEALHHPRSALSSPDQEYDRAWAGAILTSALKRVESECACNGRASLWAMLEPILFADESAPAYAQISQQFGMKEAALRVVVYRLRLRLSELIRDEVRQTVTNEGELTAELGYLVSLFAKSGSAA